MASDIVVPSVGESITEVVVAEWLKPEGAWVAADEAIVSLDTDKVSVDVPAPVAGYLRERLKDADETAEVGEVIGRIEPAEAPEGGADRAAAGAAAGPGEASGAAEAAPTEEAGAPDAEPQGPAGAASGKGAAFVMPAARRALADAGLRAEDVTATGPGGRLLKEDVLARSAGGDRGAAAPPSAPSEGASPARGERVVPMTRLRRRIAERLVRAQHEAAILSTFNEIDMSAVMTLRKEHRERFQAEHGVKLGFMSFFVKAAVDALERHPELGAEIRGDDVVYRDRHDIGVAVGGGKGLVVPVIRDAGSLGFAEIELAIADLAARAQTGDLKLEELQGGTFTISNGGVYGSLLSTPILNPPQSGILGLHAIQERPVGVDGQVVLRPMMYVALSYDHRIVDGRGAVTFLKRVKECIESPARMLLEV